jgi:hypothetical protein
MDQKQIERWGFERILPGMTFAVEESVRVLNEIRARLGRPPVRLETPEDSQTEVPPVVAHNPEIHPVPEPTHADRRASKRARQKVAESSARDWAIVKEAGIATRGRPSREMVARGMKIIERRKNGARQA